MDYSTHMEFIRNPNQLKTLVNVRYAPNEEGTGEINIQRHSSSPLRMTSEAKLIYPGRDVLITATTEETGNKEYRNEFAMELEKYETIRVTSTYKMLPRHELNADIIMPGYELINIKSHLNPDMRNMQAHGELNLPDRQYVLYSNWMHRGNRANFNTRTDMGVSWPQRKVTLEGSASREGDVVTTALECKWDAERNPDRKVSVNGHVTITKAEPEIQMNVMVYPSHFVDIDASGKYETGGWYRSESDLEGRVHLRTSFQGFEDTSASFKHDRTPTEYKTEGEVAWAPRRKISGNFDIKKIRNWNKIEAILDLNTPFEGARTLKTEAAYTLKKNSFDGNANVQWEQNSLQVASNMEVDLESHKVEGDITFRSPFRNAEELAASVRYNDDGSQYTSSMEVSWAPDQKITAAFNMEHTKSGPALTNAGDASLATPFTGFRSSKIVWQHQNDRKSLQNTGSFELEDRSLWTHNVEASMKSAARKWSGDVRANFDSPKTGRVAFFLEHEHDPRAYSTIKTETSLQWGERNVISYEHEIERTDTQRMIKSMFTSPFEGFEKIKYDGEMNFAEGQYSNSHELKYGNNKITTTTTITMNGREFQGSTSVTTTYSGYERATLNYQNQKQDGIWVTHGDLEYQPGQRVEIDTQLGLRQRKLFSVHVQTPWSCLRNAFTSASFSGTRRNFETALEIRHNRLEESIRASLVTNIPDRNNAEITVDFSSPFEQLRFLKANTKHTIEGSTMHQEGSFEIPTYRGTFSNDASIRNGRFLRTETIVEYTTGKRIILNTEFKNARRIQGTISFKSPFCEDIDATLTHEGSANGFTTEGELTYKPGSTINANVNYQLTGNALVLSGRVATPFPKVRRIILSVNHDGPLREFKNDASLQINGQTYSGSSEFNLNGNSMTSKANLRSAVPINGYSSYGIEVNHNGPANAFRNNAILSYGNQQITANSEYSLRGNNLDASFAMQIPTIDDISLSLHHNGGIREFSNNAAIVYGSRQVRGSTEFRLQRTNLVTKANLQTPSEKLRALAVEINHNGPATNFNNNALITYDGQEIAASSEFSLEGNDLTLKGNLRTPFDEVRSLGIDYTHTGRPKNFRCTGLFSLNDQRVEMNNEVAVRRESLHGKVSLKLPVRSLRVVEFEVNHNGPSNDFSNNVALTYGAKKISGETQFQLRGNSLTSRASVTTPYQGWESTSLEVTHEGGANSFRNGFTMAYSNKQISGEAQFQLRGNSLTSSITVRTPYRGWESTSLELSHEGPINNFRNSFTMSYGSVRVSGNSELSASGDNMNGRVTLNLPIRDIETLGLEIDHSGPLRSFRNSETLTIGSNSIRGSTEFSLNTNALTAKAAVGTSYPGYETMSAEISHNGPINEFQNSISMAFNNKELSASSEFTLNGNNLNAKAEARLPVRGMRTLGLEVEHIGPARNFRNQATLTVGRDHIRGNSRFELNGNTLSASASTESSYEGFERMSAEISHSGPTNDFRNSITATFNDNMASASSEFSLRGNNLAAKVETNLPFRGMQTLSLEVEHNGPAENFRNHATLHIGNKQIRSTTEFELSGNTLNAKVATETSYQGYESMSLEVSHSGPANDFRNNIGAAFNNKMASVSTEFSLNGNTLNAKIESRLPVKGFRKLGLAVTHTGTRSNFNNNAVLSYGQKEISGTTEFRIEDQSMTARASLATPYAGYRTMSAEISHAGPITGFENSIQLACGNKEISTRTEFRLEGRAVNGIFTLNTPFDQANKVVLKIDHDGRSWRNFANSALLKINEDKYTGASEFRWYGRVFRASTELNIPEEYSIKINHKGIANDFSNNLKIKMGEDRISGTSSYRKVDGNIEGAIALETTYPSFQNMEFTVNHQGTPSNFRTTVSLTTPLRRYSNFAAEISHHGSINDWESSITLSTPFEGLNSLSGTLRHKGTANDFQSGYTITVDGRSYTGEMTWKKNARKLDGSVLVETPFSGLERTSAVVSHTGNRRNFQSSASLETSYPGYERFAGELSNEGDLSNFRTSGKIETPFSCLPSLDVNVNHEGNRNRFNCGASATYKGRTVSGATNFEKRDNGLEFSANVQTPYRGYERYALSASHTKEPNSIRSVLSVETPITGYERFGLELSGTKTPNSLTSTGKLETPFRSLPSVEVNVRHEGGRNRYSSGLSVEYSGKTVSADLTYRNAKKLEISGSVQTPYPGYERFGAELNHESEDGAFTTSGTIETPYEYYRRVAGVVSHTGDLRNFRTSLGLTTTYPGYDNFGLAVHHEGDLSQFTSGAEYTSSIPGHGRYAGSIEKKGQLNDLELKAHAETPIRRYQSFDASLVHKGHIRDFTTDVKVDTSVPRYRTFSGRISHAGELSNFQSSGLVETSVPGYERFSGDVNHNGDWSTFRTTGNVETSIPGHDRYTLLANHNYDGNLRSNVELQGPTHRYAMTASHQGDLNNFNTNINVNTPYEGYERFGIELSHEGQSNGFTHTGTINLPSTAVPEIRYTITHNGNLMDCNTAASVEYNRKRIEATGFFKRTGGRSERSYETGLTVSSPYRSLRNLQVTASNTNQAQRHSGMLDITHNGEKKVDLDYSCNTGGQKTMTITIRNPRPMETSITFTRENSQLSGEGYINWNSRRSDSNIRGDFNLNYSPESHNIAATLTLPTRSLSFGSTCSQTDTGMTRNGHVQWGADEGSRFSYELTTSSTRRRSQEIYDAQLKLTSPYGPATITANTQVNPGRQYITDVALETTERMSIRREVTIDDSRFQYIVTVSHPSMRRVSSLCKDSSLH